MKFFRNFRFKAIQFSKIKNYLWYSIGEILLIFIGINLAIWFNNKTEYASDRKLEIKILNEIKSNLQSDLQGIDDELWWFSTIDNSCQLILQYFENGAAYPDSLNKHFSMITVISHFNPNYSGFSLLEAKGIDIVLTDSLRRKISYHYTSLYDYYGEFQKERIELWGNDIGLLFKNNFQLVNIGQPPGLEMIPIDIEALKNTPSFIANIRFFQGKNWLIETRAEFLRKSIVGLIKLIDEELKLRN